MRYYFDTSIWIDLFQDRVEEGFPKGLRAQQLLTRILSRNYRIIVSQVIQKELFSCGYSFEEVQKLFRPLKRIIQVQHCSREHLERARNIAKKRNVPQKDVLHALLSKTARATLITRDNHFQKLLDITIPSTPEELLDTELAL